MASPVARPVAVATVSRSAGGDLGGPILYIKGGDGLARGSRGSVVRVSALDALHGLASGSQGVALMVSPCGSPCSRWSAGGGVSGSPFMASPVWDQVAGGVSGGDGVRVSAIKWRGCQWSGCRLSTWAMVSRSAGGDAVAMASRLSTLSTASPCGSRWPRGYWLALASPRGGGRGHKAGRRPAGGGGRLRSVAAVSSLSMALRDDLGRNVKFGRIGKSATYTFFTYLDGQGTLDTYQGKSRNLLVFSRFSEGTTSRLAFPLNINQVKIVLGVQKSVTETTNLVKK